MSIALPGNGIGTNIFQEQEPRNNTLQILGMVGNPLGIDDAPAAEVRGTTALPFDGSSFGQPDVDIYQATASWVRDGNGTDYDHTPIAGGISISAAVGAHQAAGVYAVVFDAFGNVIFQGFDFILGPDAAQIFGAAGVAQLESIDTDFVNGSGISWSYPVTVGAAANTFGIAMDGFLLDFSDPANIVSKDLHYTLDWAFGAPGGVFTVNAAVPTVSEALPHSLGFTLPTLSIPDIVSLDWQNAVPQTVTFEEARGIALLYEAGLDRVAEEGGLNFWIGRYEGGEQYQQIALDFLWSDEFRGHHGDYQTLNDHDYLELLYNNILGRDGEQGGMDYWMGQLAGGLSRETVLADFALSTENIEQSTYIGSLTSDPAGYWYFAT